MITVTTLRIMTPHVRHFASVPNLIAHLDAIHYFEHAADGELHTLLDGGAFVSDDVFPYAIHEGGRAHRIDFEHYNDAVEFEDIMDKRGVDHGEYAH